MRRLPVYLLLDTSGSMKGEPIEAVNSGLETLVEALRQDPYALETVHISVITYDREATVLVPMVSLEDLQLPRISTPDSGPTHTGEALECLERLYKSEIIPNSEDKKGDWAPYLFIMTDGKPSDVMLFGQMCPRIKKLGFANIVGCVAGPKAHRKDLEQLCDQVASLDTMDSTSFTSLFKWVSDVFAQGNRSMGAKADTLPPPPTEINLV
ncbi:von Willebrand factor type A domain protein [Pseudovibrio sp. W64]|uniref:vWA domain-containing protein n=1 Tax=Pseudovibrio sp. W64 TaxID=1735583 RepID=UPI0007B2930E|nr:VWA domain-containing protein [Pseudovibrio sp. W64]KZK79087.1 von Willebrand factor type A domain protein [Pseudovibrio sp. W64]